MIFPRIENPHIPLRHIRSSIGSSSYTLVCVHHRIRSSLAGRSESFLKCSGYLKFFHQNNGTATRSSQSPILSNMYVKHSEKLAFDSAQHKPLLWLCYVDNTFVVRRHVPERLQNFLNHLDILRFCIQLTLEKEPGSAIPFLDILVMKKDTTLATKVYRKPTHPLWYFQFKSNHQPDVDMSLIQSIHKIFCTIYQKRQDLNTEISSLRCYLLINDYYHGFTDSVITSKLSNLPSKVCSVQLRISHMWRIFQRNSNM
jgi:hypothetical protein